MDKIDLMINYVKNYVKTHEEGLRESYGAKFLLFAFESGIIDSDKDRRELLKRGERCLRRNGGKYEHTDLFVSRLDSLLSTDKSGGILLKRSPIGPT